MLSVTDNQGALCRPEEFRRHGRRARDAAPPSGTPLYYVLGSIVLQVTLGTLGRHPAQPETSAAAASCARSALIPWVVPGIVAATTWAWMFHTEFGIINYMLTATRRRSTRRSAGSPTATLVMPALIAINVWKLFPFVAVMVLAGLQTVPKELYEVGARRRRQASGTRCGT